MMIFLMMVMITIVAPKLDVVNLPAQFFWHSSVAGRLPLIRPGWQSSSHLAQALITVSQYCCLRSHSQFPHWTSYDPDTASVRCGCGPDSRMCLGTGIPTTAPTPRLIVRLAMRLKLKNSTWIEATIIKYNYNTRANCVRS